MESTLQFANIHSTPCSVLKGFDLLINSYNVCIMAYGQTGSGKTHTMLGSHDLDMEIDSESLNKDEGIIPRSAKEMFRSVFFYNFNTKSHDEAKKERNKSETKPNLIAQNKTEQL